MGNPRFRALAEVSGEGGSVRAGGGQEFLDGGDLGGQGLRAGSSFKLQVPRVRERMDGRLEAASARHGCPEAATPGWGSKSGRLRKGLAPGAGRGYPSRMLDDVRALLILQDRDRRLMALAKDLEKLPQDETRAKAKLAGDEAAVAKAKEAVVDAELRLKRLEMDADTRRTTIQRLKTQQFETRKNEEYQALGHEIERYGKEIDTLETKELEIMEELDALRAAHAAAQEALGRTKGHVDEDLATISQRRDRVVAERAEVSAEREKLLPGLPEDLLPLYERLMRTKDGLAVVPMKDGRCEGCHMKVIASTIMKVHTGKEICQCENCGRILYDGD